MAVETTTEWHTVREWVLRGDPAVEEFRTWNTPTAERLCALLNSWETRLEGASGVNAALLEALKAYLVAQRRMRDGWAEGDQARKNMLWRELHQCEFAADAAIALAEGTQP